MYEDSDPRITYTYVPTRRDGKPYKHLPKPVTEVLMIHVVGDYIENVEYATEEDLERFGFVRAEEAPTGPVDEQGLLRPHAYLRLDEPLPTPTAEEAPAHATDAPAAEDAPTQPTAEEGRLALEWLAAHPFERRDFRLWRNARKPALDTHPSA